MPGAHSFHQGVDTPSADVHTCHMTTTQNLRELPIDTTYPLAGFGVVVHYVDPIGDGDYVRPGRLIGTVDGETVWVVEDRLGELIYALPEDIDVTDPFGDFSNVGDDAPTDRDESDDYYDTEI